MNWISVEDKNRLPPSLEDVLFTDGRNVFKGYRIQTSADDWEIPWHYWHSVTENTIEDVTHWMPLPELPHD